MNDKEQTACVSGVTGLIRSSAVSPLTVALLCTPLPVELPGVTEVALVLRVR